MCRQLIKKINDRNNEIGGGQKLWKNWLENNFVNWKHYAILACKYVHIRYVQIESNSTKFKKCTTCASFKLIASLIIKSVFFTSSVENFHCKTITMSIKATSAHIIYGYYDKRIGVLWIFKVCYQICATNWQYHKL